MARYYTAKECTDSEKEAVIDKQAQKDCTNNFPTRDTIFQQEKSIFKKQKSQFTNINKTENKAFNPYHGRKPIPKEKKERYERGKHLDLYGIRNNIKKIELKKTDKKFKLSVAEAARNELLLTEEAGYLEPDEGEDTFKIQQTDIAKAVDITSASKLFSLSLAEFGPYKIDYSRDGRHLLLGGQRGHVAALDWVTKKLLCETNVMESVHAISWLHLPTMFATAQKNWVHVYDSKGTELHCIKKLNRVLQMEFLPYHFLLTTSNEIGCLAWLDISVGKLVKETFSRAGRLNIMTQNPYNALVATGHSNGSVSMWSPNEDKPLARILCHNHAVRSIAIDSKGLYMATAGVDRSLKIFDIRTFKPLQSYKLGSAAGFLDFSQMDLLSVGFGNVVEVYKDCCTQTVTAPYMRYKTTSSISGLKFCPYEDVLGIGLYSGFNSILIPGAGQPSFDTFESNPYMTKSQRREVEVRAIMEKIPSELITLSPAQLGQVDVPTLKEKMEQHKAVLYAKPNKVDFEPRMKTKGKSKGAKVFKRKQKVYESSRREFVKTAVKTDTKKKKAIYTSVFDRFKPSGV